MRYQKFLLVTALSLFLIYEFLQLNMMNTLSPFLRDQLHLTISQWGWLTSMFFYANLVMLFFSGTLLDWYSPKWLMAGGILLSVIGLVVFIALPSYNTALIWRVCAGISGGFSFLSIVKVISEKFPITQVGFLIGATSWVIMPAGMLAQAPFLKLIHYAGLKWALSWNAILGVLVIMALFFCLKNEIFIRTKHHLGESFKLSFGRLRNWGIALFAGLANLPLFLLGAAWGNLYLLNTDHVSMMEASFITSAIYAGNMVGAPLLGALSDRLVKRGRFLIIGAVIYLVSTIMIMSFSGIHSVFLLVILFFLLGVSTTQAVAYAFIIDVNRSQDVAKATSLISFFAVGGGALSENLFASLINKGSLDYSRGFLIIFISGCILFIISLLLYRLSKRKNICQAS